MARGRAGRVTAAVVGVVVLAAAGYGVADAYDVVPGLVTLAPPPPDPEPFPTAPAAVPAPSPTPLLGPPDDGAPVPDAAALRAYAEAAAAHAWMGDRVGVVVADQLTGDVLVDLGGDVPQEPASTAKVLTAVAAVRALGADTTFPTRVVHPQSGRLVLVGGGDVMLAAGEGDPDAVNGRAGVVDLARQTARALRLAGVEEVTVAVDDHLFSGPTLSPGWEPTDLSMGYVSAVTPVAVNLAKTREEAYPPRHADPSLHAGQVLAQALAAEGVRVVGDVARVDAPDGAPVLAEVRSATVAEIVRYGLHTSDNTVSEVLGRLTALARSLPGSFEGATTAVLREVGALGVDVTGARLVDCSGLADGSSLSTHLLVDLLLRVVDPQHPELRPVAVGLPVAGWQGTLADRLLSPPAAGLVRAKTGSLTGTTALAGTLVTAQGRPLVFAVIADATPPGGQLGPRRVIDALVQQVAGCACTLP